MSARKEVQNARNAALHIVQGGAVRVHVTRLGGFAVLRVGSPIIIIAGASVTVAVDKVPWAFVSVAGLGM